MAKKKAARAPQAPQGPATVTDKPLVVRFTDGSTEVFPPGRIAEVRHRLLVVGYQGELEGEYRAVVVKGWRYDTAPQTVTLPTVTLAPSA